MKIFSGNYTKNLLGIKIFVSLLMTVIFYLIYAANFFSTANLNLQDIFFSKKKIAQMTL